MTTDLLLSRDMSSVPVDLAVFSKDRRPILVVDVRAGAGYSTAQLAAGLRRSLLAHGLLPSSPFFMIATPIQLFLWREGAEASAWPEFSASARSVLDAYGSRHADTKRAARGGAFEIVLFSWLSDIASGLRPLSPDSEPDRVLLESGLYEQIRDGTVDFEVRL